MDVISSNVCTRCGKARIDGKSWTEKVEMFFGTSTVVHTETMCPDPECQKIVEEKLAQQKQKSDDLQLARDVRMKEAQAKHAKQSKATKLAKAKAVAAASKAKGKKK